MGPRIDFNHYIMAQSAREPKFANLSSHESTKRDGRSTIGVPPESCKPEELIHAFGREEYLRFFKDQRYENAKLIFGDRLDKLIADFEEKINNV